MTIYYNLPTQLFYELSVGWLWSWIKISTLFCCQSTLPSTNKRKDIQHTHHGSIFFLFIRCKYLDRRKRTHWPCYRLKNYYRNAVPEIKVEHNSHRPQNDQIIICKLFKQIQVHLQLFSFYTSTTIFQYDGNMFISRY